MDNGTYRFGRDIDLKGLLRWNRESGGDDKQNNLELGIGLDIGRDLVGLYDISDEELGNFSAIDLDRITTARGKQLDFSAAISSSFARTAQYADLSLPVCAPPSIFAQCSTQHDESLRNEIEIGFFGPKLQNFYRIQQRNGSGELRGFAFIISPKIGLTHDVLLNSPVDTDTGLKKEGSYVSGLVGLALNFTSTFVDPRFEISFEGQLRQSLIRSNSRRSSIDSTAERLELSGTYYLRMPNTAEKDDFRVGLGISYIHGHDPLNGEPEGDKVVLALRLGFY